jgi:hypothetical protein
MSTELLEKQDETTVAPTMLTPFSFGLAGSVIDGRGSGVIAASIRTGDINEDDPSGSCDDSEGDGEEEEAPSLS